MLVASDLRLQLQRPAASSSRTPPSQPRASARSRATARDPRGDRKRASTSKASRPARELLDQINPPGEPNDSLDDI